MLAIEITTCDLDRMEVLARASILPTESVDYDAAAALRRTCRQRRQTARKLIDCLIAAVVIRGDVPILHMGAGFDILRYRSLILPLGLVVGILNLFERNLWWSTGEHWRGIQILRVHQ